MRKKAPKHEQRTSEQLKEAYEIEKDLSSRLRTADREERRKLYREVYDEWNKRVFSNPSLSPRYDPAGHAEYVLIQKKMLTRFLDPGFSLLEVGAGDCSLSRELAACVGKIYAIDVSQQTDERPDLPNNMEFIISDGVSIPLPQGSVNMAYSSQLMEHLHPDDAFEQLCSICDALASDGAYLCVTPNRFYGPHDISEYFDDVATGFHLKEYSVTELISLFGRAGFSKYRLLLGARGFYIISPAWPVCWIERFLSKLPYSFSKRISSSLPFRVLLGIKLIAMKQDTVGKKTV